MTLEEAIKQVEESGFVIENQDAHAALSLVLSAAEKQNEYEKCRDDWASTMEQAEKQEKDGAAWNRRTDNG